MIPRFVSFIIELKEQTSKYTIFGNIYKFVITPPPHFPTHTHGLSHTHTHTRAFGKQRETETHTQTKIT